MKVVCDNCGAVYKVPDEKLVKPVNKATCRQCGHRMLIPRPRADADPNERTLVTAVPPTPMGAPMREMTGERKTTPIDDEPEKTLPGRPAPAGFNRHSVARDEVPIFPGTPLPAGTRSNVSTADAVRAAGGDTVKSPDYADIASAPEPAVPQHASQRPQTPRPAPRHPGSIPSHEPRRAPPRPMVRSQPPSPSHQSMPSYVAHHHDPSGDMTIAMAGVFGTLLGIFILALLSVWPWRSVLWLGLAISIGGSITSLLILITGGRGTRPAWLGTSMVTGVILAIALATGLVSTHYVGQRVIELDLAKVAKLQFAPVDPGLPLGGGGGDAVLVDPEPTDGVVDGGDPIEPEPAEDPEPTEDPEPKADPEPKPRPKPRPAPAPSPRPAPAPSPRPAPAPSPRPAPAPVPLPVPVAAPVPAPVAASSTPSQVSYEVIDVMLRTNLEVKKCFYEVLQTTGQLPPRVDVNFNLMPTGSVTGVKVKQPEFAGSSLETCLGSAIRSVEFPPSSGNGQKIVYPFVLQ